VLSPRQHTEIPRASSPGMGILVIQTHHLMVPSPSISLAPSLPSFREPELEVHCFLRERLPVQVNEELVQKGQRIGGSCWSGTGER